MRLRAVFLDFYGTLAHEDDDIIPGITEWMVRTAAVDCTEKEVAASWWQSFSAAFRQSRGAGFESQRRLALRSLEETVRRYGCAASAEELIRPQFDHWVKPGRFADTLPFLEAIRQLGIPAYILSNIDTADVLAAAEYNGIVVHGIVTSEDVRSYKPNPEMFREALQRFGLERGEVLHFGDSLTSDVEGAQGAGIRAVWVNRKGKSAPERIRPDYTVTALTEALPIVERLSGPA